MLHFSLANLIHVQFSASATETKRKGDTVSSQTPFAALGITFMCVYAFLALPLFIEMVLSQESEVHITILSPLG